MKSMLSMVLQCQGNDIVRGGGGINKLGYPMPVKSKKQRGGYMCYTHQLCQYFNVR